MTYEVRTNGDKTIRTSVYIKASLHELVKLSGKSFTDILERAILEEFSLVFDENDPKMSEKFRETVEKLKEEEVLRLQKQENRIELIRKQIETARAQALAEEIAAQEIERREQDREATHKRKLVEAWAAVSKKRHFTPDKIRRWLPENDREGDHIDQWEALPTWLSREAEETFTTDEILTYAKGYAQT